MDNYNKLLRYTLYNKNTEKVKTVFAFSLFLLCLIEFYWKFSGDIDKKQDIDYNNIYSFIKKEC